MEYGILPHNAHGQPDASLEGLDVTGWHALATMLNTGGDYSAFHGVIEDGLELLANIPSPTPIDQLLLKDKQIEFQQLAIDVPKPLPTKKKTPPDITPEQQRVLDLEQDIQRIRDESAQATARLQAEHDAALKKSLMEAEIRQASEALDLEKTIQAALQKQEEEHRAYIAQQTEAASAAILATEDAATLAIKNVREFLDNLPPPSPVQNGQGSTPRLSTLARVPSILVNFMHKGFGIELKNLIQTINKLPIPPAESQQELSELPATSTPQAHSPSSVAHTAAQQTTPMQELESRGQYYHCGLLQFVLLTLHNHGDLI